MIGLKDWRLRLRAQILKTEITFDRGIFKHPRGGSSWPGSGAQGLGSRDLGLGSVQGCVGCQNMSRVPIFWVGSS